MRKSLVLSVVLHLILLVVVVINFSTGSKPPAIVQPMAVNVVEPSEISQVKAGNSDKDQAEKDTQDATAEKSAEKPGSASAEKAENTEPTQIKANAKPAEPSPKSAGAPPPPKPKTKTTAAPPVTPPLPKPRPASRQTRVSKPAHAEPVRRPEPKKMETTRLDRETPEEGDDTPSHKPWKKIEPRLPSEGDQYEEDRLDSQPQPRRMAERDDEPPVRDHEYESDYGEANPDDVEDTKDAETPAREPVRSSMNAAKSKFDSRRIAALIDRREPSAGAQQSRREPPPPHKPWRRPSSFQDQVSSMPGGAGASGPSSHDSSSDAPPQRRGSPDGDGDRLSANEIDAFRAQVSRCWTPPVGGLGADAIIVKLHIILNQDGTLARPPRVENRINSPFFTPAADSALRAVLQCEPYRMPPEKFSYWRDMLLTFDPRQMYGG